jgi:hypothetical protein
MSDPFASAQVSAPAPVQTVPAQPAGADPFTPATDLADPFLTNSDVKGSGEYIPSPSLEVLEGRLVVMIPRSFDPAAKDPNDPSGQKTRELYTVDLTVLSGGRLEYVYKEKANPEQGRLQDEMKTWTVENVDGDNPFTITGFWVPQGSIIGRLKKVHAAGAPFLGVPAMGPTAAQRKAGVQAAAVKAQYNQWVQMGKPGNRPSYAWHMIDPAPEMRAVAVNWWSRVRSTTPAIVAQQH